MSWYEAVRHTASRVLWPHGPGLAAQADTLTPADYSVHFFLQLATILIACRLVGAVGRRWLNQPQVVGEMVAGVMLGPSLLGWVAPGLEAAIFPVATKPVLYAVAQLGVGLYMFLVGLTVDLGDVRARARSALGVAGAGVVAAFLVAVPLSMWLARAPGLFAPGISGSDAALFLGACIGLTAFPMLARIITERGLTGSALGTLALTAGALDDAVSWCVLAVVLATFGGGAGVAILAIGGALAFAALLVAGRRLLVPLRDAVERTGVLGPETLAATLALFCLAAFAMDAVGIHAIFGGFALGVAIPRGRLTVELRQRLEPLTVALLLPVFFTYSGLNTRVDLIASPALLPAMAAVLAASFVAKLGACWAAARWAGEDNRTALAIGTLMNARGLMELIIVDIGLQRGIIQPALGAMLVIMTVVSTALVGPVFDRLQRSAGTTRRAQSRGADTGPELARTISE